jgi:hypothetical protein
MWGKSTIEKKVFYLVLISFCSCLVSFSGCGLTEYYTLDAPTVTYNSPSYTTTDYTAKYFDFLTRESGMTDYLSSSSDFVFLGTAVYYKIYNNYSTMLSRNSSISSVNTSSNYSSAATKMIETYEYQQLGTDSGTITPLVSATGSNRRVYIRLMHYGSSNDYAAKITIAGTELAVPLRVGNKYTFDFGRTSSDDDNAVPVSGDDDVEYGTASSSGKWYVDMYAVAVGRDSSYTTSYSLVLHLGSVTIDQNETDN